jgi:hypothetical protein
LAKSFASFDPQGTTNTKSLRENKPRFEFWFSLDLKAQRQKEDKHSSKKQKQKQRERNINTFIFNNKDRENERDCYLRKQRESWKIEGTKQNYDC